MDSMTIHDLDDDLIARLRTRAAQHNRSMEDEALSILMEALASDTGPTAGPGLGAGAASAAAASDDTG